MTYRYLYVILYIVVVEMLWGVIMGSCLSELQYFETYSLRFRSGVIFHAKGKARCVREIYIVEVLRSQSPADGYLYVGAF